LRVKNLILPSLGALALTGAPAALAAGGSGVGTSTKKAPRATSGSNSGASGGAGIASSSPRSTPSHPVVAGSVGKIIHGLAYAPANAPIQVQRAIWAGDKIRHTPYIYGGGHGSFNDAGYDCSGAVSYVLHAAGLVSTPMDSSEFMSWAHSGLGHWITVYTNPGHAFVEIAGIRFDTSSEGDATAASGSGPRWHTTLRGTGSYQARHPGSY
jgi:cell wall-associated NlpC family hydrolase